MSKKPQKIIIEIPPTPIWDVMEWCTLHNLKKDLIKEPTTTTEVLNTLVLKMWSIEDRNPDWNNEIRPSLLPYLKKWGKEAKITPMDTFGQITRLKVTI